MQPTDDRSDLQNLPDFLLSEDDRISRIDRHKTNRSSVGKQSRPFKQEEKGFPRSLVLITILLIVLLAGAGAWQLYTTQSKLNAAEAQMNQMTAQLDKLVETIAGYDHSTAKNTESLKGQIKAAHQAQKKLEQKVTEQKKLIAELQPLVNNNKKDLTNIKLHTKTETNAQNKTEKDLTDLNNRFLKLSDQLKMLSASQLSSVTQWHSRLKEAQSSINSLSELIKKNKLEGLNKILDSYDAALKSVNDYRLQINQRLLQLENSIRELQTKGNNS